MTTTMAKSYRGPVTSSSSLPLAAPFAMLALLMSPQCRADWKVTPAVDLRETYTDNVRLESSESARSQFITDLAPSLSIASDGPRLKLHAAFATHLYAYSDDRIEGTNRSQRQLAADAKAKLIEDLLFFDGSASIGQQSISAFGPQVNNNGYSSTNRTEVSTWRVSPYLAHRFGSAATAELRYVRDSVKSGDRGLGDSTGDTVSLSIASGPAFRTVGWGLQYSRQDLDDSFARKSRAETASASLRFRISEALSLNANGGYDKYDYEALGGKTAGKSYSLGFTWSPSLRTSIQASAGKRYFGSSYSLIASHRSRSTVWSVNYNDAVTTTRSQFLLPATVDTAALLDNLFRANYPDPLARQQAVDAYLRATGLPSSLANNINYFSNRFILQKQLQAAAAFNTAKTTTIFSLNGMKRNALSTQQSDSALLGSSLSTLNDNTRQFGGSAVLNYRINTRTGINLLLSKTRTKSLSTGIKDNQKLLSLTMTRQLQRKLKGAVELRRNQGSAEIQGGRTYRENAISASLSLQL
jgi:uncharacterized protein (PEP-CTERM system associated)